MAANPGKAATIEAGVARLLAPTGMGTRFCALGVRSKDVAAAARASSRWTSARSAP